MRLFARMYCQRCKMRRAPSRINAQRSLKRFQKTDEVSDLPGFQSELRHSRMTGGYPFGESVFQGFDRVMAMKGSKRRRRFERTAGEFADRMAMGAVGSRKFLAPINASRVGQGRYRSDGDNVQENDGRNDSRCDRAAKRTHTKTPRCSHGHFQYSTFRSSLSA